MLFWFPFIMVKFSVRFRLTLGSVRVPRWWQKKVRGAEGREPRVNFMSQTYTLARRSYSQISSLMLFKLVCSCSHIGCGRVILCWFQPNCGRIFCRYSCFVFFVLCVRMKVALHCIKMVKITWISIGYFFSFIYITYRIKCRDKINASFCIFISSSLSFQVTFKAFYSSLLSESEFSCHGFASDYAFIQKLRTEELGQIPQDRELFGSV